MLNRWISGSWAQFSGALHKGKGEAYRKITSTVVPSTTARCCIRTSPDQNARHPTRLHGASIRPIAAKELGVELIEQVGDFFDAVVHKRFVSDARKAFVRAL